MPAVGETESQEVNLLQKPGEALDLVVLGMVKGKEGRVQGRRQENHLKGIQRPRIRRPSIAERTQEGVQG